MAWSHRSNIIFSSPPKKSTRGICHVRWMAAVKYRFHKHHTEIKEKQKTMVNRPSASASLKGSITVEATLGLPLFIMAMIVLSMAIRIHSIDSGISDSLISASVYAEATEGGAELAGASAYLMSSVTDEKEREPFFHRKVMQTTPLVLGDGDMASVSCITEISGISTFGIGIIQKDQSAYVPLFMGYEPGTAEDTGEEEYIRAYMTEYGSVYHINIGCTYLTRRPKALEHALVGNERNSGGGKYYPCRFCRKAGENGTSVVWVTEYGDRYHWAADCKALRPVYKEVMIKKEGSIRCCSKCGNGS